MFAYLAVAKILFMSINMYFIIATRELINNIIRTEWYSSSSSIENYIDNSTLAFADRQASSKKTIDSLIRTLGYYSLMQYLNLFVAHRAGSIGAATITSAHNIRMQWDDRSAKMSRRMDVLCSRCVRVEMIRVLNGHQ